jgi:hypothetical protein
MKFRFSGFTYRGDPNPDSPVEWEDNWLSNLAAYVSHHFLPRWCQTPEHWTSRLSAYFWTDCPCCLFFRGVTVGIVVGGLVSLTLVAAVVTFT